jgi:hypothetical protein
MAEQKPGSQIVPRTSVVDSLTASKVDPLKAELQRYQQMEGDSLLGLVGAEGKREAIKGYTYSQSENGGRRYSTQFLSPEEYTKLKATSRNFNAGQYQAVKEMETYTLSPEERMAKAQAARQQKITDLEGKIASPDQLFSGVEGDLIKGARLGEAALGPDGLGRLGEDSEIQDVLGRFKDISETGLSSAEAEAKRAQAIGGIDRSTQTSQRALQAALARAGVKGSTAGQQMLQAEMGGLQAKANVERDLFLESEQIKRQGLADYSQRLGDVKTFDIGQAAKEKDIALQTGLAFAQMGSAKDIAKVQAKAAEKAAAARAAASRSSCFAAGTKVKLANGAYKNIEEIELGEELSTGKVLSFSIHIAEGNELFEVNGNVMTGNHVVLHNDAYVPAFMVGNHVPRKGNVIVYDLIVEDTHRIELENGLLAMDQDGFNYDANAMAEFLNEIEGRENVGITKKVSAGEV